MKRSLGLCLAVVLAHPASARIRDAGFESHQLWLPGMPAAVIPADMDGDGRQDLVLLVAYTGWGSKSEIERKRFGGIEGLVEVMTVVDALVDRRELRVYLGSVDGRGYSAPLPALDLSTSVHALDSSHPHEPLVAITDEGLAAVRVVDDGGERRLRLVPLVDTPTSLSHRGEFHSELRFLHDLDNDGVTDALLPTAEGWALFRGTPTGFAAERAALVSLPEPVAEGSASGVDAAESDRVGDDDAAGRRRHDRLPAIEDVDGDGMPDLVHLAGTPGGGPLVWANRGNLGFAAPVELALPGEPPRDGPGGGHEIVFVGDLDGDRNAEVVGQLELEVEDEAGFRESMEAAKKPTFDYRLFALEPGLAVAGEPHLGFEAVGYTFSGSDGDEEEVDIRLPGGFKDLDGDGRDDLVSITLDFSLVPLLARALVVGKLSLRMDFHPWCQLPDGRFVEVPGLDLSGKFKLDFRKLEVRHLSQFAGDFNGDGRADFVQLGRGRKVTIHQGQAGCRYPPQPDRKLVLEQEPRHLGLVRILDLDADGRSDLYVVQPQKAARRGAAPPVRLDLYFSRPTAAQTTRSSAMTRRLARQ